MEAGKEVVFVSGGQLLTGKIERVVEGAGWLYIKECYGEEVHTIPVTNVVKFCNMYTLAKVKDIIEGNFRTARMLLDEQFGNMNAVGEITKIKIEGAGE